MFDYEGVLGARGKPSFTISSFKLVANYFSKFSKFSKVAEKILNAIPQKARNNNPKRK
ncbi:hypothetical protein R1539_001699 [Campylobacter upsaliensis]|nr:hypothetical protein [Campylobacter upsaliensis]